MRACVRAFIYRACVRAEVYCCYAVIVIVLLRMYVCLRAYVGLLRCDFYGVVAYVRMFACVCWFVAQEEAKKKAEADKQLQRRMEAQMGDGGVGGGGGHWENQGDVVQVGGLGPAVKNLWQQGPGLCSSLPLSVNVKCSVCHRPRPLWRRMTPAATMVMSSTDRHPPPPRILLLLLLLLLPPPPPSPPPPPWHHQRATTCLTMQGGGPRTWAVMR